MELTRAQRKRLAKEMRGLAMECLNGTNPVFTKYDYCGCAVGEVVVRAGLADRNGWGAQQNLEDLAVEIDQLLIEETGPFNGSPFGGLVSVALLEGGPEAAVFPLLALADELENAARSAAPKGLLEEGEGKNE